MKIMKSILKIKTWLCMSLFLLLIMAYGSRVLAETTTSVITNLSRQQDLTVHFTFDVGTVDIVFISPAGERKSKGDEDVEFAEGGKWATYRIHDAQPGTWQVEYDFGENTSIDYSVIRDDYGLWIQSFTIGDLLEDGRLPVSFQADCEDIRRYNYEIYATGEGEQGDDKKIADGSASTNELCETSLRVGNLSSGTYTFRLEVYGYDGDVELFDVASAGPFVYQNPKEPEAMENFKLLIDEDHLTCTVDWSDFLQWYHKEYRLSVFQDGELLSTEEYGRDVHAKEVYYRAGTKKLEIVLSYQDGNIWSAERRKTVTLGEEYLTKKTGEVSSSAQILIQYKKNSEGQLNVKINNEEGTYRVNGEQEVAFHAQDGWNTVHAEMACDDFITYVIDDKVYYDMIPPSINLYEKLDGRHFTTEEVTIIGKMEGGVELLVNGEAATLNERGEFSHAFALTMGENVAEIVARDVNGNEAKVVLTFYRDEAGKVAKGPVDHGVSQPFWVRYLPLLIALAGSLAWTLYSIIFLKKPKVGKSRIVGNLLLWDGVVAAYEGIIGWLYFRKYSFGRSVDFFELAERSGAEAAKEMNEEAMLFQALIIGAGVLVLSILVTVLVVILKKRKDKKKNAEKTEG